MGLKRKTATASVDGDARRIEYLPLAGLKAARRNPKKHADNEVKASIGRFGYVEPMVVDERTGSLVAGHGRRDALSAMKAAGQDAPSGVKLKGKEWLVPVLRGWESRSDIEAEAYLLASNQLTTLGGWDNEQLAEALKELSEAGALEGVGFGDAELTELLDAAAPTAGATDPDDVPETPSESYVKPGDLYQLGKHRLLCGDATNSEDVDRLMDGEEANCVLTDPPYGQSQPGVTGDEPDNLEHVVNGSAANLPLKSGICVAFQSPRTFPAWLAATMAAGHKHERMLWLSKKAQMAYPWRGWILKSEAILVSSIGTPVWNDVHPYVHDTYEVASVQGELEAGTGWHGSVKPIAIVSDILSRISSAGAVVYEPFSGSGTTLLACERLGRRCCAIELEPKYVQVAIERWEKFTGKKAKRVE